MPTPNDRLEYLTTLAERFKNHIQNINQVIKQSSQIEDAVGEKIDKWQAPMQEALDHFLEGSTLLKNIAEEMQVASGKAKESKEARKVTVDRLASISTIMIPANIAEQPALLAAILVKAASSESGAFEDALNALPPKEKETILDIAIDMLGEKN